MEILRESRCSVCNTNMQDADARARSRANENKRAIKRNEGAFLRMKFFRRNAQMNLNWFELTIVPEFRPNMRNNA